MATEHELKTWPEFFNAVERGDKTFEIRRDDRGFHVGDVLVLREWNPTTGRYGRSLCRVVTYIIAGLLPGGVRLPDGVVVMGLRAEEYAAEAASEPAGRNGSQPRQRAPGPVITMTFTRDENRGFTRVRAECSRCPERWMEFLFDDRTARDEMARTAVERWNHDCGAFQSSGGGR